MHTVVRRCLHAHTGGAFGGVLLEFCGMWLGVSIFCIGSRGRLEGAASTGKALDRRRRILQGVRFSGSRIHGSSSVVGKRFVYQAYRRHSLWHGIAGCDEVCFSWELRL